MRKRIGSALIALAFACGIIAAVGTSAEAQWRTNDDGRYRTNNGYGNQQQLNQGYQYGIQTGAADAQRRQNYSPQRSRYYRGASSQAFREGFVRGYDQGYRQYANNGGQYGNGGNRNDGYYGNGGYGNGGYGNDGYGNGGYNNQDLNRGYQQGINTGASDGRSRKSYSPQRSRHYQNASTQAFREGFVRGYDQGYRQYAGGYGNNGGNSGNWGTILGQILGRP